MVFVEQPLTLSGSAKQLNNLRTPLPEKSWFCCQYNPTAIMSGFDQVVQYV